jgi:hypothetical protein
MVGNEARSRSSPSWLSRGFWRLWSSIEIQARITQRGGDRNQRISRRFTGKAPRGKAQQKSNQTSHYGGPSAAEPQPKITPSNQRLLIKLPKLRRLSAIPVIRSTATN